MQVRCPQCFYENEERYRFCGMCGVALPRLGAANEPEVRVDRPTSALARAEAAPTPPPAPPVKQREPIPVTGPSFLGLSQDQNPYPDRSLDYLLEEEPQPGRARMYIAIFLLIAAVGMLAWRWRHSGYFARARPAVVATPSVTTPPALDPSTPEAAITNPAPANAPAQAGHGSLQESDLPPGSTSGEAAKPVPSEAAENSVGGDSQLPATKSEPPSAADPAPTAIEKSAVVPVAKTTPKISKPAPAPVPVAPVPDPLVTDGERYLYGTGVPQNCARAQKSLLAAAGHASVRAQSILGTMYATGHCVGRDLPTAYRWFAKASHQEPTNARITRDLEVLWKQMTAGERQIAVSNRD